MWGNRIKRKKDEQVDSFIGPHSQFEGDIRFGGRLHVQGTIKGNVLADNGNESVLTVEQTGTIEGEVRVPYIYMNGVVTGDVYAHQHIELGSSARIEGNVYYNLIEMAMGAEVNGKLVHLSERDRAPLALGHAPEALPDPLGNT